MPTERFYHLPEEKRMTIRKAAIQEFARVPLEQVSINKIIQSAGISRGSFYTYFEDKRDVMIYLLEDIKEKCISTCIKSLERNDGDYFKMLEELFEYLIQYFKENEHLRLYRNMMLNTDVIERMMIGAVKNDNYGIRDAELQRWCLHKLNMTNRNFRDNIKERFELLDEIIMPIMMKIIIQYFIKRDYQEAKEQFRKKLGLLKCIVYRD